MRELYDEKTIQQHLLNDEYGRIDEIVNIDKLIGLSPNIKLGINGNWGSGKSVVARIIDYASNYQLDGEAIKYCESKFHNFMNENCFVIYYDASKEDIFNNPLLSLVKVISKYLDAKEELEKNDIFESLMNVCLEVPYLSILARGVKEIKKHFKEETYLNELYNTEFLIKKVKELFDENRKYVLIIDELDRCDPKYVLKLFNTIKHFFDLDNLAIMYFYNYDELWHLIKNEYGYENEQYLQKFVDYEIKLNPIKYYHFANQTNQNFNVALKICAILYNLNPREINNLSYIYSLKNDNSFSIQHLELLVITHFLIKKLGDEEFNYKTLRDKKGILTNFIDENLILRYFRIIADSFDRTDFKMNIDLIKEKYAM